MWTYSLLLLLGFGFLLLRGLGFLLQEGEGFPFAVCTDLFFFFFFDMSIQEGKGGFELMASTLLGD
jgi:hypothetical protein